VNVSRIKLCQMTMLIAATGVAGCSVFSGNDEAQWRKLTVMRIQSRAELSTRVDISCMGSVAAGPNEAVAVVKFRVNRAPYLQAFAIPAGRTLHLGDTVVVNPSRCILKDDSLQS